MKRTQIPVLVTGGAGYIGSHVCKALSQNGFLPITYDNLSTGHAYAVKWGPFIQGDLRDSNKLDQTFSLYRPVAVMHFAANAIVVESISNPLLYYKNNVGSTLHLLESMQRFAIDSIVFSSTCATYGIPKQLPITEEQEQSPINPYGRSKLFVEQILSEFEELFGLRFAILRYFNAAGADFDLQIGEDHTPETHLIPNLIQSALQPKKTISVYGTDFPTEDGSAVRDYIHVQDLAQAHVLALQALLEEKKSFTHNLGTERGYSVLEIVEAIQKHSGKDLSIEYMPRRKGEPAALIASAKKAQSHLNWKPTVSDLSSIIQSAWKWHHMLSENASHLQHALERIESQKLSKTEL